MSKPLQERPYAQWLEDLLHGIEEENPTEIAAIMRTKDGNVATKYWNCDQEDKGTFAHYMQLDSFMDTMLANADDIVNTGNDMICAADNGDE